MNEIHTHLGKPVAWESGSEMDHGQPVKIGDQYIQLHAGRLSKAEGPILIRTYYGKLVFVDAAALRPMKDGPAA